MQNIVYGQETQKLHLSPNVPSLDSVTCDENLATLRTNSYQLQTSNAYWLDNQTQDAVEQTDRQTAAAGKPW